MMRKGPRDRVSEQAAQSVEIETADTRSVSAPSEGED